VAREHANIRLDMWGDADWRALSRDAQWLYELLLTHPDTNRAGVSDWRPGRLAKMAAGTTADDIRRIAAELEQRFFVVIDEDTEEILVRSYVKYDGVLKQPNMTVTMVNDWAGVASSRLRAVVAFEVQKVKAARPDMPAWRLERIETLMGTQGIDVRSNPSADPRVDPSVDPKPKASVRGPSTSTSTSTSTNASHSGRGEAKKPEIRLPKAWAPSASHIERAKAAGVDVVAEAEAFRLHAETHDRHAANWNAAFTTWLSKAKPMASVTQMPKPKRRIGGPNGLTADEVWAEQERRAEEILTRGRVVS